MSNYPKLKPVEPMKKLKYNEIGVKSDLKGNEIKNLIDKVIFILIYKNYPNVTLKSRGKGTSKLIIDILQRIYQDNNQKINSKSYLMNQIMKKNYLVMDVILSFKERIFTSQKYKRFRIN